MTRPSTTLSRRRPHWAVRLVVAILVLAVAPLVSSGVGAAHVEIEPTEAPAGQTVEIVFVVENEQPDAGTTQLQVQFPRKIPIASATPTEDPTWQAEVTTRKVRKAFAGPSGKTKKAVDQVIFTGGPSEPGEVTFELPPLTIGPLPKQAKSLYFKVIQTYENGDVDRWIELPLPGGEEPEGPAPVLVVVA